MGRPTYGSLTTVNLTYSSLARIRRGSFVLFSPYSSLGLWFTAANHRHDPLRRPNVLR